MVMSNDQPLNGDQPGDDASAPPSRLTPAQERAISALLSEPTLTKAAEVAGVNERTVRRWLSDDADFGEAYRRARRDAFSQATGLSQRLAPNALVTLAKIMNDSGASHSARVSAATNILRFGREALELDDLAARVAALEAAAKRQQDQPHAWQ